MGAWMVALVLLQVPGQAAAPAAPAGRRYVAAADQRVRFSVPTNIGVVEGTVGLSRLEVRGVEGWGRFELRGALDPADVRTGDELVEGHISRWVLQAPAGSVVFGSTKRLPPRAAAGAGQTPDDEKLGLGLYLDARRQGRYLEPRYAFTPVGDGGRLQSTFTATLDELGLPEPRHPFIRVTGPITVSLDVALERG